MYGHCAVATAGLPIDCTAAIGDLLVLAVAFIAAFDPHLITDDVLVVLSEVFFGVSGGF